MALPVLPSADGAGWIAGRPTMHDGTFNLEIRVLLERFEVPALA